MDRIEQRIRSLMAFLATAALLAIPANLAAQGATEAEEQQQQEQARAQPETGETSAPAPRAVPQVTGTIASWNGYRIDLKTPDGKTQQVAVNEDTERMVEIKPGAEVTIEYRRKIGDFVIAERVRPVEEAGPAPQPGPETAPSKMTGTVVSWTPAALVLRTAEGDVTLFLSPRTESLVKSVEPGLPVTVEYEETSDGARLAVRVQPAEKESDSE
ncbi:MAG TPA: hypothetical protein VF414_02740 [Thermoanaerobaculia bacterium]